jgi:hypothetical protein
MQPWKPSFEAGIILVHGRISTICSSGQLDAVAYPGELQCRPGKVYQIGCIKIIILLCATKASLGGAQSDAKSGCNRKSKTRDVCCSTPDSRDFPAVIAVPPHRKRFPVALRDNLQVLACQEAQRLEVFVTRAITSPVHPPSLTLLPFSEPLSWKESEPIVVVHSFSTLSQCRRRLRNQHLQDYTGLEVLHCHLCCTIRQKATSHG